MTNTQEEQYMKEYSKMGISVATPLMLAILGAVVSQQTKIGGTVLYTLAGISSLYTAKVFYTVMKKQSKSSDRDFY